MSIQNKQKNPLVMRALLTALLSGMLAFFVIASEISVPIPGTDASTDPREIFTLIGAAISGPIFSLLVGFLAGAGTPETIRFASIFTHILFALCFSLSYRFIIFKQKSFIAFLFSWALFVILDFYLVLIPAFLCGLKVFHAQEFHFFSEYRTLAAGAFPEVIFTAIFTTAFIGALPRHLRKQLSM